MDFITSVFAIEIPKTAVLFVLINIERHHSRQFQIIFNPCFSSIPLDCVGSLAFTVRLICRDGL